MTPTWQKALSAVAKLPPEKQEAIGDIVLEELSSDRRWDKRFASKKSQDVLARMADEALEEHRQGRTRLLEELFDAVEKKPASRRRRGQPGTARRRFGRRP